MKNRVVFNYRRALREPKKIRQITDNYYLPFTIEFLPALNFVIFLVLTFILGYIIRKVYPYAFSSSWFIFLVGVPLMLTWLVTKIKPEGKNIYRFLYDYIVYLISYKIFKKKICNGVEVKNMHKTIIFKQCVEVVDSKNGKIKTSVKDNQKQFYINENGRRICLLQNKKRVNFDSKSENGRIVQKEVERVF